MMKGPAVSLCVVKGFVGVQTGEGAGPIPFYIRRRC